MAARMKLILLCSVVLNLGLGAWCFQSFHRPAHPVPSPAPSTVVERVVLTNTPPFHWRQVESPFYPVYIANLRAIGCPEQTIHDIVTADLKSVFEARRSNLGGRPLTAEEVARHTQALEREESQARQVLLGPPVKPGAANVATSRPAAPPAAPVRRPASSLSREELVAYFTRRSTPEGEPKMIYAGINPTEEELRQVYELNLNYQDEFGKGQPNPADAAWEKRRRAALRDMDDLLRSLIGDTRYGEYLRDAIINGQPGR